MFVFIILSLMCEGHSVKGDSKLEVLLNAKSIKSLRYDIKAYDEAEQALLMCEKEVRERKIPISCYKDLYIRRKTLSSSYRKKRLSRLDELCLEAPATLSKLQAPDYLSETCKKNIETRNQEVDYILKEQDPYKYIDIKD